jgi:hypothetical protein
METILTIKWSAEDVTALAKERGINPEAALEAVNDSISQLEDRSIETGWNVINYLLNEVEDGA